MKRVVCINDPAHFPFTGTIIRSGNINTWSDKIFLNQLRSIATGNSLQFLFAVFSGINFYASFCTSEWNIHDGTFIGHKGSQSHYLILIYMFAVADSSFGWKFVMAVLNTVAF